MKLDDKINYFVLFLSRHVILVLHLINRRWNNRNSDNIFPNAFVNFYLKVVLFVKIISILGEWLFISTHK